MSGMSQIDQDTHALHSYYPDFLIELKTGEFCVVEIKGEHLLKDDNTLSKIESARHLFSIGHQIHYKVIPSKQARMLLTLNVLQEDFLGESHTHIPTRLMIDVLIFLKSSHLGVRGRLNL